MLLSPGIDLLLNFPHIGCRFRIETGEFRVRGKVTDLIEGECDPAFIIRFTPPESLPQDPQIRRKIIIK